MKTALAKATILSVASLLSACANLMPPAASTPAQSAKTERTAAAPVDMKKDTSVSSQSHVAKDDPEAKADKIDSDFDPKLPSVELTADLMYQILGSEIAAQRGQWQRGFVTLQALAQQTRDPRLARRAMEIAYAAKSMGEALSAARLWRELAPDSDEAAQAYLLFAVMQDKMAEVMPAFVQRLKETPEDKLGPALITLYQRYLSHARNKALMFPLMETLYAPYSKYAETHLALAQAALYKGDQARALSETKASLKIKPDSQMAMTLLMYVNTDVEDTQKTVDAFLANNSASGDLRLTWARMLADRKHYEKSAAQFEILRKDAKYEPTAISALGEIAVRNKDYVGAEKYFVQYLGMLEAKKDESREIGRVLILLSQLAQERNDNAAALTWLEKVSEGDHGHYFSANTRRAALLYKAGKFDAAVEILHTLSANSDAEKIQLIQQESQMLRDEKRSLQAFAMLDKAIKTYPENTDLLYDHAMMAEKLNRLAVMESSFRKVIKLSPDNHHAYNALGYSLAERNIRLPEAFSLIEKALKMAPADAYIMDSMGWVQFKLGKLKDAEATLRKAFELRPDAEIAAHLGEVLWTSGQKDAAKQIWRDALKKEPDSDILKTTLARLHVKL